MENKTKKCPKCGKEKPLHDYHKDKNRKYGVAYSCKMCKSAYDTVRHKEYYHNNRDREVSRAKEYRKTIHGFLNQTYQCMTKRVDGRKLRSNLKTIGKPGGAQYYVGLPILDRDEFLVWSKRDKLFKTLFKQWEKSGYEYKLTPSVDRVDVLSGYIKGNMEWVTVSENTRNAHLYGRLSR